MKKILILALLFSSTSFAYTVNECSVDYLDSNIGHTWWVRNYIAKVVITAQKNEDNPIKSFVDSARKMDIRFKPFAQNTFNYNGFKAASVFVSFDEGNNVGYTCGYYDENTDGSVKALCEARSRSDIYGDLSSSAFKINGDNYSFYSIYEKHYMSNESFLGVFGSLAGIPQFVINSNYGYASITVACKQN